MFTSLVKVEGELRLPRTSQTASAVCRRASNSLALMASVPPPMVTAGPAAEDATQEVVQDVVCRGDGGHALPA
jgi:hypothetical protein